MQQTKQRSGQQERQRGRPFLPGQSGNPAGRESAAARRERLNRKVSEIVAEFGGHLSPFGMDLAKSAAELLMRRPVDVNQQVRVANAISRIYARLQRLSRSKPKAKTTVPSVVEMRRAKT